MRSFGKVSSILLLSSVVVMLQMLMLQASTVDSSASPSTIQVGLSSLLDVNCTSSVNIASSMAAIFSLTVSRGNNSVLASITSFADHQVNVISSEEITADGVINPGGQSYIHLHWDYPTDTQKGTYQCVARGIDDLGHNVESVNTSVVSVDQVDLQGVVREMRNLRHNLASLEYQVKLGFSGLFHTPPLTYHKTQCYVSLYPFHYFNESMNICKSYGGILLEINDEGEFRAIQVYMKTFTIVKYLHIGGIDPARSGNWVLPSTNQPLPFTDWYADANGQANCLCLTGDHDWRMYSCGFCNMPQTSEVVRYMCEFSVA